MKSGLAYSIILIIFTVILFGFVFYKANNVDYTLKNIKINIEMSADEADIFKLYYSEDHHFCEKQVITKPIKGYSEREIITFNIPDNENNYLRLDLSKNSSQTNITIHKIAIESNRETRNYKGAQLQRYFPANAYIKAKIQVYKVNYTFKRLKALYDPFLGPVSLKRLMF